MMCLKLTYVQLLLVTPLHTCIQACSVGCKSAQSKAAGTETHSAAYPWYVNLLVIDGHHRLLCEQWDTLNNALGRRRHSLYFWMRILGGFSIGVFGVSTRGDRSDGVGGGTGC